MIKDHESVDAFIGVDVGKTNHHAMALDRNGSKLLDKALPQDEAKLRAIIVIDLDSSLLNSHSESNLEEGLRISPFVLIRR